ncbi:MAG: DUF3365 domain-containing protein [Rhodobacterales bacterium]|nr:DUF3365 domain-containing protein [Rhodobacterales bacterium]
MNKILLKGAIALMLTSGVASAQDINALKAEGKALIQQFAGALKGELVGAMKAQGAPHAISVCNVKAPEIANQISVGSDWTIARSSHLLRNPGNAPDAYTAAAIDSFLAREANGEMAKNMVMAGIIDNAGQREFRMVKAIPTGEACVACHGAEIPDAVNARLAELYPEDQARGFSVGDMRGVFTLTKVLD